MLKTSFNWPFVGAVLIAAAISAGAWARFLWCIGVFKNA